MVCIYCGGETEVINSRRQKRNNQVWRRRQCRTCKAVFTTHEGIDLSSALIVDSKGSDAPFLADRLFADLLSALKDHKNRYVAARELTNAVIQQLLKSTKKPRITSQEISAAAAKVLKRFDKRAYLRYIADHPSLQR